MNNELGLFILKSTAGYLGIRAQNGKPINTKLPRLKNAGRRRSRRDLGSLGFTLFFFSFLFFSFLFFSFLLVSVIFLEQVVSARLFYFLLLFLDLNVIVELKLNAEINFFSNYYLERMEFSTIFWNSMSPVSYCSRSTDQ